VPAQRHLDDRFVAAARLDDDISGDVRQVENAITADRQLVDLVVRDFMARITIASFPRRARRPWRLWRVRRTGRCRRRLRPGRRCDGQ
jgi:hypothetical protein